MCVCVCVRQVTTEKRVLDRDGLEDVARLLSGTNFHVPNSAATVGPDLEPNVGGGSSLSFADSDDNGGKVADDDARRKQVRGCGPL